MPAYLIQIDGYDPVAAAAVSLYAASQDDERICHLNGQTWWPAIAKLPPLRYDLVDAGFSGRIDTPGSSLSLNVEPWPDFARYALADARLRLWSGEPGEAWASWVLRFDGRVTAQPATSAGFAEVPFAVDDRWLDTPLLPLYAGTTGAEGPAALKGQPKPLAIGAPRYCPAVPIDTTNLVFQLSAYAIEAVDTAFERLLAREAKVGDYASYAALVAATIPPGQWASGAAVGMVRLGALPYGKQTFQVRGDKGGAEGWVRLPGSVIRRLALLAGGTGKIHEASLTALNASRPWNISWLIREQITAREAIQRIAASVNAVAGVNWLGQLFAVPIPDLSAAATITLDSGGSSLPMVAKVDPLPVDPPFWRLAIETERTEEVHSFDELAGLYVDRGLFVLTESYRENHIVQDQGMSWLYINAAPSTGNAPPTLPATSNAYWRATDPKLAAIAEGATKNVAYRQVGDPRPSNTINPNDLWVELVSPMRVWIDIGGTWQTAANYVTSGPDIGVEAGATKNVLYRQSTSPASPADGAFWVDTSLTPNLLKQRIAGVWQLAANLVTQGVDIGVANGATVGRNLIVDGNVESGTTAAFTVTAGKATLAATAGAKNGGSYGLSVTKTSSPQDPELVGRAFAVVPGRAYIYQCDLRGQVAGSASGLYFSMNKRAAAPSAGFIDQFNRDSVDALASNIAFTGAFQTFKCSWTNPGGSGIYWASPAVYLAPGSDSAYLDNWSVVDTIAFDETVGADRPEPNATVGRNIGFGPPEVAVPYDYAGTTTDTLPRDYSWKLYKNGVEVTTGVTWTYAVTQGTFNTFTLASGTKTMSGTGVGTLTASSLGTNDATLLLKALHESVTTQLAVKFRKDIAAAPAAGGGGSTTTLNSKTSGFTDVGTTTYVDITGTMAVTMPTGKTAVSVSINLDYFPDPGANGNWTLRLKLQRSIAAVWTDVGSPATLSAATASIWNSVDGGGEYGNITGTIAETGLTAGSSYSYRVMGQLVTGTRNQTLTGGSGVVITA